MDWPTVNGLNEIGPVNHTGKRSVVSSSGVTHYVADDTVTGNVGPAVCSGKLVFLVSRARFAVGDLFGQVLPILRRWNDDGPAVRGRWTYNGAICEPCQRRLYNERINETGGAS